MVTCLKHKYFMVLTESVLFNIKMDRVKWKSLLYRNRKKNIDRVLKKKTVKTDNELCGTFYVLLELHLLQRWYKREILNKVITTSKRKLLLLMSFSISQRLYINLLLFMLYTTVQFRFGGWNFYDSRSISLYLYMVLLRKASM